MTAEFTQMDWLQLALCALAFLIWLHRCWTLSVRPDEPRRLYDLFVRNQGVIDEISLARPEKAPDQAVQPLSPKAP